MSKLIRIPYQSLPDINALTEEYQVRYRLKSDDGNRVSAWSPIYGINPNFTFDKNFEMIFEKANGYTSAVWEPVRILTEDGNFVNDLTVYDVWVRYSVDPGDNREWQYQERVFGTSLNIFKPLMISTIKSISIEIYRPSIQATTMRARRFDVYQDSIHVDLVKNRITFDQAIDFENGEEVAYEVRKETGDNPIGGLTDATNYFVNTENGINTISLHPTRQDALDNTNTIDLTSHPNSVGYFTAANCTLCDHLLYSYAYLST
jgi:hypothetical protein